MYFNNCFIHKYVSTLLLFLISILKQLMFSNKLPVCSIYCINFKVMYVYSLYDHTSFSNGNAARYRSEVLGISSVHAQSVSSSLAFRFGN